MPTNAAAESASETSSAPAVPLKKSDFVEISYGEFGRRFFRQAVTEERINDAVADMAGRGIQIGPLAIGGAGVHAEGKIGQPAVTAIDADEVAYSVTIPAGLLLHLKLVLSEVKLEASVEIDLTMRARAAAPLLMVIDIPAINEDDVRIVFRAEALGAMWQWIIEPMGDVIRREIASRINAMMSEPASASSRIFDVKARIQERESRPSLDFHWISYEEFGAAMIEQAVDKNRIVEAVADLDGRPVQIGPMKTGPKDMAEVSATGSVRQPTVAVRPGKLVNYLVNVPVGIDLKVALRRDNRYATRINIPLALTVRTLDPLRIFVDVTPPSPDDIEVDLKSQGMGAAILGLVGGIKRQMAEQVAATIATETADPTTRVVDVAERIAQA